MDLLGPASGQRESSTWRTYSQKVQGRSIIALYVASPVGSVQLVPLLPVLVAVVVLGLVLGAGRGSTGGTADDVVAGFAVCLGLLIIRAAGLVGFQEVVLLSSGSRGLGLGGFGGLYLGSGGRVGIVVGVVIPGDFLFLINVGTYMTMVRLLVDGGDEKRVKRGRKSYPSEAPCASVLQSR